MECPHNAKARCWAAGLEFGRQNPRAATQIVMEQFPGLASQMNPSVATESMMQLANVFAGRWDERKKWGYHIPESWQGASGACKRVVEGIAVLFDSPSAARLAAARETVEQALAFVRDAAHSERATREVRSTFERMSGYLHFLRVMLAGLPEPEHADATEWAQAFLDRR